MRTLRSDLFLKELDAKFLLGKHRVSSAVSISGGKDSLVSLDLACRVGIRTAIYCNTTMDYPGTSDYVKQIARHYDITIHEVRAPVDFLNLVKEIGFPSRRVRWCCDVFKFGPLAHFVQEHGIKTLITGLRSDESVKRKEYTSVGENPLVPVVQINPIVSWSLDDVWDYIRHYELPYNRLYDEGHARLGCWPCPFQTTDDLRRLKVDQPELHDELVFALDEVLKKFGTIGIHDKRDYIENHAWVKYAPPQRNMSSGIIEYDTQDKSHRFSIRVNGSDGDFDLVKQHLKIFDKHVSRLQVNESTQSIIIESEHLHLNQVLIYCEKEINCKGCGACRSLCPASAISVVENHYRIDWEKCTRCLSCVSTTKIKGACVARHCMPVRKKFDIHASHDEDFHHNEIIQAEKATRISYRTRKPFSEVFSLLTTYLETQHPGDVLISGKDEAKYIITPKFDFYLRKYRGLSEMYVIDFKDANAIDFLEEIIKLFNTKQHPGAVAAKKVYDSREGFFDIFSPCGYENFLLESPFDFNGQLFEFLKPFGLVKTSEFSEKKQFNYQGERVFITYQESGKTVKFTVLDKEGASELVDRIGNQVQKSICCKLCGKCAESCPVGAIEIVHGKLVINELCNHCEACTENSCVYTNVDSITS